MMKLEKNWHSLLSEEIAEKYIDGLKLFLDKEGATGNIVYPEPDFVFNAFRLTPPEKVRVVLIGQDPYHGEGQAHGLCFSVPRGVKPPPSLKNIFKELRADVGIRDPDTGCLCSWASQGVLLLNATLTVRAHEPRSHYGQGWESFTDAVVECLARKKNRLVFLLWGLSAKNKCVKIFDKISHNHKILVAAHPSPLSANNGFFGCRHFSKTNDFLKNLKQNPIDWNVY